MVDLLRLCTSTMCHNLMRNFTGNAACTKACNSNGCANSRNVNADIGALTTNILDIESLIAEGTSSKTCPWSLARHLASRESIDVVLMPYTLLFQASDQLLNGSIVLYDEAHNVPSAVCEFESVEITKQGIDVAMQQVGCIVCFLVLDDGMTGNTCCWFCFFLSAGASVRSIKARMSF